jgi:glycosyltransferase involved in cell wall biosynthesis
MSARALPLARELAARGWRVRLALPPWDAPEEAGRDEAIDGVSVVNVALDGGPAAVVARLVAAARAWRAEGAAEAPVVHCFKPKGYGGLAAAALRLAGWPLVVDNDDWEGRGGWNERVAGYSAAQRVVFGWQARSLPRAARAVTVASRTLQTQAWGQGIPPARVHYLPNGLSTRGHAGWREAAPPPAAERAALGLGDEPVMLLYTRFDVVAPERAVALLAAVRARCPAARLLVVGRGLAGEDARLLAAARAAGLAEAIVPTGFVPFERLPATLLCADVALYPIADDLINRAKAPMKLLEMMALGLPVVAEAVGETPAYIEHTVSGLLTPAGDDQRLAATAARLLDSPEERSRLGLAARERVWRCFAWERLADIAERAYAQARSED